MYFIRGTVMSLSAFFLTYVILSGAVACCWKLMSRRRAMLRSESLYALRILPLLASLGTLGIFVIPSFVYLEPRAAEETIGIAGVAIAIAGAAVITFGLMSVLSAWRKASRFVAASTAEAKPFDFRGRNLGLEVTSLPAGLLVVGICRPKLLISSRAAELLHGAELETALQHELAHVDRHHNLKKLLLRFCPFPLLATLDREWIHAAELEADDAAASDANSALDLASALIKIARESSQGDMPDIAMALAPADGSILTVRVQRLLSWEPRVKEQSIHRAVVFAAAVVSALVTLNYASMLTQIHEFTELLVR